MKIKLEVAGRMMTFKEEVLSNIVEWYLKEHRTIPTTIEMKNDTWYLFEKSNINPELFAKEREDEEEEKLRWLILDALRESENNSKYDCFELLIPTKTWRTKTFKEFKKMALDLNGHSADWVYQSLAWAQMLSNGVEWESLCQEMEKSDFYKVVIWKNGYVRLVGGSCQTNEYNPATHVSEEYFFEMMKLNNAVPLIARQA